MTMITATYPLALDKSDISFKSSTPRSRAWGFWATLGWMGLATITFFAAAFVCSFAYGIVSVISNPGLAFDPTSPVLTHLSTLVAMPAAAVTLIFAARRAGIPVNDYLGLKPPKLLHIVAGLAALAAFLFFWGGMSHLFPSFNQSGVMTSEVRAAAAVSTTAIILFLITAVVSAPIAEEIIFRGFAFRGWHDTWLGNGGALALSSALFAAIHMQYNVPGMAMIFGLGLVFGLARWLSGSTLLAIILHAMWNFVIVVPRVIAMAA